MGANPYEFIHFMHTYSRQCFGTKRNHVCAENALEMRSKLCCYLEGNCIGIGNGILDQTRCGKRRDCPLTIKITP